MVQVIKQSDFAVHLNIIAYVIHVNDLKDIVKTVFNILVYNINKFLFCKLILFPCITLFIYLYEDMDVLAKKKT